MRAHCMFVVAAALALTVLVPSVAAAGTTSALSSILVLPAPAALKVPEATGTVPGLTMKSKEGYGPLRWLEMFAATSRGYCIAQKVFGFRWMGTYGASARSQTEDLDLDRLTEKDGVVTLERTRVHFDPPSATITATGRSHVVLTELTRTAAGVVVWAYREDGAVVVLAKRVERGVESHQLASENTGGVSLISADGCPFAGARLDARKPDAGSFAQLSGALVPQGTGKDKVIPKFIIDASLSRVARDPEPLLAVRVRMQD